PRGFPSAESRNWAFRTSETRRAKRSDRRSTWSWPLEWSTEWPRTYEFVPLRLGGVPGILRTTPPGSIRACVTANCGRIDRASNPFAKSLYSIDLSALQYRKYRNAQ